MESKRNKVLFWLSIIIMAIYVVQSIIFGDILFFKIAETQSWAIDIYNAWASLILVGLPIIGLLTQYMYVAKTDKEKKTKWVLLILTIALLVIRLAISMLGF